MMPIMKNKNRITILSKISTLLLLGAILILLVVSILFAGCNKKTDGTQSYNETYYEINGTYDGDKTVNFTETVVFTNNTSSTLSSIALHLYPNAYKESAEHSPFDGKELEEYKSKGNFGGIEVLSAKIDRLSADFVFSNQDETIIEIPHAVDSGQSVMIEMECSLTLPVCAHRLGIFDGTVNLTGFYPILCALEDGVWLKNDYHHFGDPFVHDVATYSVCMTYPSDFVATGSGIEGVNVSRPVIDIDKVPTTPEGLTPPLIEDSPSNEPEKIALSSSSTKTTELYVEHIGDFALVLSKNFKTQTGRAKIGDGVTVNYFYKKDSTPSKTLSLAIDVLERFSYAFGDYPYPTYTLVESYMQNGGMEYGALSIVSNNKDDVIIHETAHQWWYGIVGNNQIEESWLDEGLAEFSTAYYRYLKGDQKTFSAYMSTVEDEYAKWKTLSSLGTYGLMKRPLTDFLTEGEYVATAYVKGAILFNTLRQVMGDTNFSLALKDYATQIRFKIASAENLISSFEKYHSGIGGVINSFVEGKDK